MMNKHILLLLFACGFVISQARSQSIVRLYAVRSADGAGQLTDSLHYTYSGNRGGDETSQNSPQFDEYLRYKFIQGSWNPYQRKTNTYSAVSKPLVMLTESPFNSSWRNLERTVYHYDASDFLLGYNQQSWDTINNSWKDFYTDSVVYDSQHNTVLHILINTNGGNGFDFFSKDSMVYDAGNRMTEKYYITWNGSGWDNVFFISYTYDVNNDQVLAFWQSWSGSVWETYSVDSNSYDAQHNLLSGSSYSYNGTGWETSNRYTYTYDAANNMLTELSEVADATLTSWENYNRSTMTYDNNHHVLTRMMELWSGGSWQNSSKQDRVYHSSGKEILVTNFYWSNSQWTPSVKFETVLDINNLGQYQNSYAYQSGNWQLTQASENWFQIVAGIHENNFNGGSIAFPNPAQNQFQIRLNSPVPGPASCSLYDEAGRLAARQNIILTACDQVISWSRAALLNGVYFYTIQWQGGKAEGKVLLH